MVNAVNNGSFFGNLAADPAVHVNSDGSRLVRIAVYALNNYTDADGGRGSQRIQFERFFSANASSLGIFEYLVKGTPVALNYHLEDNNYTDKNTGEQIYRVARMIDDIQPTEPRSATDARRARNQAAPAQAQANQNAPAPQNQQFNQAAPAPAPVQTQASAPAPAPVYNQGFPQGAPAPANQFQGNYPANQFQNNQAAPAQQFQQQFTAPQVALNTNPLG